MYLDERSANECWNIMNDLNVDDNIDSFRSQILDANEYNSTPVNIMKKLLQTYKQGMNMTDIGEDHLKDINRNMRSICVFVIDSITEKYKINIDEGWLESNDGLIIPFAVALYQFFITDYFENNMTILKNYIKLNFSELVETFRDIPTNNDVSTKSNIKNLTPELAIIINHIYDVTDYVWTLIDTEDVFSYMGEDNSPAVILATMYNELQLSGDFVSTMREIYKENIPLRSKLVFEILYILIEAE